MSFEAEWLAARAPYDEAALDPGAVKRLVAWGASLPPAVTPVVVDLGSGTGAALRRVAGWLAPRSLVAYAVDQDAALLARAAASVPGGARPVVCDVLRPLAATGGPTDGTVDLVVGHALADLMPLERLAGRAAALVRPGGLVQMALAYDGLTEFRIGAGGMGGAIPPPAMPNESSAIPAAGSEPVTTPARAHVAAPDAALDAAMIAAFHRHMDRPARTSPTYGGSTAGRRLGAALGAAGLEVLTDAPAVWRVHSRDGEAGRRLLARLIRYVADAAREVGDVQVADIRRWEAAHRAALDARVLSVRVGHRDVLARRPA